MHRFVKGELNWVEPLNQNFEEAAAHAAAQDNPHGVTAEQLGAPTKAYVDAQLSKNAYLLSAKWGHSQKNVGFKPFGSTLFFLLGISNKYPIGLTCGVVGDLKALADST